MSDPKIHCEVRGRLSKFMKLYEMLNIIQSVLKIIVQTKGEFGNVLLALVHISTDFSTTEFSWVLLRRSARRLT